MNYSILQRYLLVLTILCIASQESSAQLSTSGPRLTWEQFITEYTDAATPMDDEESELPQLTAEEYDYLEELTQRPLQLNRAQREDLLRIPFLTDEAVDSLIAYRTRLRGIYTMGELMLIKHFSYTTRRWLSLFLRADSAYVPPQAAPDTRILTRKFSEGKHEIETRVEIPLYQREGQKTPSDPTATNYFTGNALSHVIRYRYNLKRQLAYGITLQKEAGEPAFKQGFCPYDYTSAYLSLQPAHRPWGIHLGDFEVRAARGLIFGRQFYGGRTLFAARQRISTAVVRPHTSTDEANFFRGAAVSFSRRAWSVIAFASFRKLDANIKNDTVRTILTTGQHRTVSEIEKRRSLACTTAGASLAYSRQRWGLQLLGCYAHYGLVVSPTPRFYNTYYFHGRNYGGASAFYYLRLSHFTLQGETATDHNLNLATEHSASLVLSRHFWVNLQYRNLSSKFVSIYGDCLQQSSHTANEEGIMLAATYQPHYYLKITAGADLFRFKRPTYTTILSNAKGIEAYATLQKSWETETAFSVSYRLKSRQRTITGYERMEFRTRQQLDLSITGQRGSTEWYAAAKGSLVTRQTGRQSIGVMACSRFTWSASEIIRLRGFAALFLTDDYESSLYAYEPRLLRAGGSSAFFHHGAHASLTADIKFGQHVTVAPHISSTRYFDISEQSSGVNKISSPWKTDCSLQLRLLF